MDVNNEELTKDLEEQYAMLEEEIQEDKKKKRYLVIFLFFLVLFLMIFGTTFSYYKLYEGSKIEEKESILKDLYIDGYKENFGFNPDIYSYSLSVKKGTTSVNIRYILNNQNCNVEVIGNENLKVGVNEVIVKVTDENGNELKYIIYVTVEGEDESEIKLDLKNLEVTNHQLNEKFVSTKHIYTVDDIKDNEDKIVVRFELLDPTNTVKLKLNGAEVTRKPIISGGKYSLDLYVDSELVIGANRLEIKITDSEGNELTYNLILVVEETSGITQEVVEINVEYGNSNGTLLMDKVIPGWESPEKQHIKITNNSNYDVDVDINWTDVTNDFINKTDLEYTLYKNNTVLKKGILPSQSQNLIKNLSIDANSINNYYISYRYIYSEKDQNIDQGKTFMSKLQVSLSK